MSEEFTSSSPCKQKTEWKVYSAIPMSELEELLNKLSNTEPPWEIEVENVGEEAGSDIPGYERKVCVTATRDVCACTPRAKRARPEREMEATSEAR
jgi:hypothetical protein